MIIFLRSIAIGESIALGSTPKITISKMRTASSRASPFTWAVVRAIQASYLSYLQKLPTRFVRKIRNRILNPYIFALMLLWLLFVYSRWGLVLLQLKFVWLSLL